MTVYLDWRMLVPRWVVRIVSWWRVHVHQVGRWPCASTPTVLDGDEWHCGSCAYPRRGRWLDA